MPRPFLGLLLVTTVLMTACIQFIFLKAPVEATMGIVQKIFYFHVPSAFGMYLGAVVCFIGSAGYLARGTLKWDTLAHAGADVAVIMGMIVMTSGPLWAAKAWGRYWTWDPRLTTSMLSLLVYVAYLLLRNFAIGAEGGQAERRFAAALGVLGAANLPIIRYSVQKWGGQHPKVISEGGGGLQHPDMQTAFTLGCVTMLLLCLVLVWLRMRVHLAQSHVAGLEQEAVRLGLTDD
jgi:heme exporter protein C